MLKSILFSLILVSLIGCDTITISQYDAGTDQQVTALQKDNTQLFLNLQHKVGTPDFKYDSFQPQFEKLEGDIQSLKLRVDAIPNNSLTQEQVDLLKKDFDLLQKALKNGMGAGELVPMQDAMDRIYGAILKLELAKRDMRQTKSNDSMKSNASVK